jgi:predicted RNA-binding protein with PIN domain
MRWLVDAFNVIGARPDGWWRDRPAAVRRLLDRLEAYAERTGEDVRVVLDSGPPDLAGRRGGVEVVIARTRGRDAADEEIARLAAADTHPSTLTVVTSDSALASRVRAAGTRVEGAGSFQHRLDDDIASPPGRA